MVNDTTTLNGALSELGETLATNITAKGVTASASDGLTTLANKVLQISGDTPTPSTVIFEDDCSTDNTSDYTDIVRIGGSSQTMTLTYDSTNNYYVVSGSGGDYFCGRVIPTIQGRDKITISAKVMMNNTSAYNQCMIGITDTLTQGTSGTYDMFRIRADKQADYLHNGGNEVWGQSNVATFNGNWVTIELSRDGTEIKGKVYDSTDTVLISTTQTGNSYSNPYYFIGINTRNTTDTKNIKDIQVKTMSSGSDCSQYTTQINNAIEYINGSGS